MPNGGDESGDILDIAPNIRFDGDIGDRHLHSAIVMGGGGDDYRQERRSLCTLGTQVPSPPRERFRAYAASLRHSSNRLTGLYLFDGPLPKLSPGHAREGPRLAALGRGADFRTVTSLTLAKLRAPTRRHP